MHKYIEALQETGIPVTFADVASLTEAAELKVTDETLTKMFKFITDKYNALDFDEIEKCNGDYRKFKYRNMLHENLETLKAIYEGSPDPGAAKYLEVIKANQEVATWLGENATSLSELYKKGNGVIQLLFNGLVAGMLFSVGVLVSNTIRFVTTEQDTDCEVLFDEIPGSIRNVHIKNILAAANDIPQFNTLLHKFYKSDVQSSVNESVVVGAGVIAVLSVIGVILVMPKIANLIREIIYSVYYTRVKISDMLKLQIDLINTNIDSLSSRRDNTKKIVARQRKIVDKLEKWKNRIAVKIDGANTMVKRQRDDDNRSLALTRDNPIVTDAIDADSGIML